MKRINVKMWEQVIYDKIEESHILYLRNFMYVEKLFPMRPEC